MFIIIADINSQGATNKNKSKIEKKSEIRYEDDDGLKKKYGMTV